MLTNPRATYRIQLTPAFGFDAAAAIVPYLAELGISHLYCSPILQAASGSTHGYDVVDHSRINHELGGAEAYGRLCDVLRQHHMSHILDVVPNHMAITGSENPWWWDVLGNGPSSPYAAYFDVDWDPPQSRFSNMVLLPVLGDRYGSVLEAGELQLRHQHGEFTLHYHEHIFPVEPCSLSAILAEAARQSQSDELAFLADCFAKLPLATARDRTSVQRRHRDKEVLFRLLLRLCHEQPAVSQVIDAVVIQINTNYTALDELIGHQNYRLAFWRMAEQDLGYRRFFAINSLAGLRVEDMQVFDDTHRLILSLVKEGQATGLRIDHPDGLREPEIYLQHLQEARPQAWILVEKILETGENLPETWPVHGTTGYDFLNRLNGLFVDPAGEEHLTEFYREFTGSDSDFETLVYEKKMQIMRAVLGSDVNRLTGLLLQICERHRQHRDYSRQQLQQVLRQIAACFPVYRTYINAETGHISQDDKNHIEQAIAAARDHDPELPPELCDFLQDLLLLQLRGETENEFVMRFQQFTAPVMAKGAEDTAFYCYNRLLSLNEVGGDPGRFGIQPAAFHQGCRETQQKWPQTMLASSTHDTKRSEDVRARLNLLSEIPQKWSQTVRRWAEMNERLHVGEFPDRNMEFAIYQTLVSAWPIEADRVLAFVEKAGREAKEHTSWMNPNPEYENAVKAFVQAIFKNEAFVTDLESFVDEIFESGRINSLAQTLVKLTAPGVPDIYQGTELWDLSLVDPDNRRPVDFDLRRRLLAELPNAAPEAVLKGMEHGLPKLWVIRQTLALRKQRPEWFSPEADYQPLKAKGAKAKHAVAFSRAGSAVVVVPRLVLGLANDWADTEIDLPRTTWRNEFTDEKVTGGKLRLAELLSRFPVCLLSKEEN